MKKICLVTYTRKTENFTDELIEIGNLLKKEFENFKCVLFSEGKMKISKEANFPIKQINMPGTKYKRLKYLMEKDDSGFYLSVDNDIKAELENLKEFVNHMIDSDADIGWGKIMADSKPKLISKLVAVDKVLSHYLIRPLLWKFGYGISIPGQCFMLKRESFSGKLLDVDTFLDDLALGLYVNMNSEELEIYQSKRILGHEEPNDSFKGLWKQRSRWAKGFSTIIEGVKDSKEKQLVSIHGFTYHLLWIVNWLMMLIFALINPLTLIPYLSIISLLITRDRIDMFIPGLLYQFIFPIFHMRWIYCFYVFKDEEEK